MEKGYLALVLHAHLPYVRHPEHESFLQERWLFEAISDTYIPLLKVFEALDKQGVDYRMTISLSPTLIAMLKDDLLVSRYLRYLDKTIDLAGKEVKRTASDPRINRLAVMYLERYKSAKEYFECSWQKDLTKAFAYFYEKGKIELITCAATHGYMPFIGQVPAAAKAQIGVAVDTFKETFGSGPKGFWLPECAYYPGHDEYLAEYGIEYFFVETHGITLGVPRPAFGIYSPYRCDAGLAVFGRDPESSKSVWSAQEGYPGDYRYREYYRDIGFDLEYDYVEPYINGCGTRVNTGIKYHRITGHTGHKDIYDREDALSAAATHAEDFIEKRMHQLERAEHGPGNKPVVVTPYYAELFGHWWFEGPEWLNYLFLKLHYDQDSIGLITPSEYLEKYESLPEISPAQSSWGYKGYHEVWLDGSNNWIYRHLHKAARVMVETANEHKKATGLRKRVLDQMARELLLAQASDWAFIMKTGTFYEYAEKRTKDHVENFHRLHQQLSSDRIDVSSLKDIEKRDNVFKNMNYEIYAE